MESPFTISQWLTAAVHFNRSYHTLPLLLVAFAWVFAFGWQLRHYQPGATVARILLAWGILHVLVGRQGVYVHEWWWSPLTPGLAVSAALILDLSVRAAERCKFTNAAKMTTASLILFFASWTALTTYQKFYPDSQRGPVTTINLGQAIKAAAPKPNDIAMLVWNGGNPQLWFYGNRPLRPNIWSTEEFKQRLQDDYVELIYGFRQPWTAPGAGIVFPIIFKEKMAELWMHLCQNYRIVPLPSGLEDKYVIFDLRRKPQ